MIVFPTIPEIFRITQSLAVLDLILMPEWQYRYYSFNSQWSSNEQMASMRNGSGDEWFLLFHKIGWAALKGFAHQSPAASIKGLSDALQKAVPDKYESFSTEPAFRWDTTTFCYWCDNNQSTWQHPLILDGLETGAKGLLEMIVSGPEGYRCFAEEYYECEVDLQTIKKIFQHHPVDSAMVSLLNPDLTLEDIQEELFEIGYS